MPVIEINGEHVVKFIVANTLERGYRGNVLIYEDGIDKKVLDEVLTPMLEPTYSEHGMCEHEPLVFRRKERSWN